MIIVMIMIMRVSFAFAFVCFRLLRFAYFCFVLFNVAFVCFRLLAGFRSFAALASCRTDVAVEKVRSELQRGYINPSVSYNKNLSQFVILSGKNGKNVDTANVTPAVEAAIAALQPSASVQLSTFYVAPTVTEDDPRLVAG